MPSPATAIGVDIGGTKLRVARVSDEGQILDSVSEPVVRDPEHVIGRVIALARRVDAPGVGAIGIGVPGRVDARRREALSGAYLDFAGTHLARRVEAALNKPLAVENDGTMALAAEAAFGRAAGFANVVMFVIGTGIGGAVMADGDFVRGRATAGQLGHVTVEGDGLPCTCGRRGCVETTSSGTALNRLIEDAGLPRGTSAETLFERAAAGDRVATGVLGAAAHRALDRAPARSPWYQCPVVAAKLGDDAGVIGAARLALRAVAAAP